MEIKTGCKNYISDKHLYSEAFNISLLVGAQGWVNPSELSKFPINGKKRKFASLILQNVNSELSYKK
jgi:hypothetical protein